eukprot:4235539-Pyramimonas_sp.AAC.1
MVINFTGYSMLVVYFYGHPSVLMRGANRARFSRLGGLLKATRLPWAVVGDFNVSPAVPQASPFAHQLDAVSCTAPGGGTCAQKKRP